MKKIFSLLLAVIMIASVMSLVSCKSEETITVGYTIYEPMNYQDENGKVSTFKYEYDESGVILTGPRVEYLPEGALVGDTIRYTYEYDDQGRVIRMAGQQTNGKDISYEFIYDDQGRVVKATNVMPEGNVTEEYHYEGDRLAQKSETLKDGTTVQTYTYGTRYIFNSEGLNG